jgi:uncharacterized protein YcsI (UPF0317 family)
MVKTSIKTNPQDLRSDIRSGKWNQPTVGLAPGYVQANLVILPKELSFDFLLFCQRNPKPCPILEVIEAGKVEPARLAPRADLRTDLPSYRIFREGEFVGEEYAIKHLWRDNLVSFLLGCSFTFDSVLMDAGIPIRHIEEGKNIPMYVTSHECVPAGIFTGPLVVSMRPIPSDKVAQVVEITRRYPTMHGEPIHIGDPEAIGITDLSCPEYGDNVNMNAGEVPVFWACGVTPQAVAIRSKPSTMITHSPGHMFITDLKNETLTTV